jgi:hypothetical protein
MNNPVLFFAARGIHAASMRPGKCALKRAEARASQANKRGNP